MLPNLPLKNVPNSGDALLNYYDADGNLASITDPENRITTFD